jgi:AraC-like DNA-binding protein
MGLNSHQPGRKEAFRRQSGSERIPLNHGGDFLAASFTTRQFPVVGQFTAWREFMSHVADISLVGGNEQAFEVDHRSWDLGGITLEQTFLPSTVERRWRHLPRSTNDHWCLVLAYGGRPERSTATGGRSARLVSFRSLTKAFEGRAADRQVLTLYLPRDRFRKEANALDAAHGAVLSGWQAGLIEDHLAALARALPSVPRERLPELGVATAALVRACLAASTDHSAQAEKPIVAALRERARRIVRQNMGSSEFGPEMLGRLVSVSRSKLYRVFESSGGVARFIQHERLEEAHRRLAHGQQRTGQIWTPIRGQLCAPIDSENTSTRAECNALAGESGHVRPHAGECPHGLWVLKNRSRRSHR